MAGRDGSPRSYANARSYRPRWNALLWIAKVEVPKDGVKSKVTKEDMEANLDPKKK